MRGKPLGNHLPKSYARQWCLNPLCVASQDTLVCYSNVGNEAAGFGFEVTKEEMAGGEVEGLVYGGPHGPGRAGWVPVNAESSNPSLTLVDNPPYFDPQQEEVYGGWLLHWVNQLYTYVYMII